MMDKEEDLDVTANEVVEAIREEISDEIADLEDYARQWRSAASLPGIQDQGEWRPVRRP